MRHARIEKLWLRYSALVEFHGEKPETMFALIRRLSAVNQMDRFTECVN